MFKIVEGYEWVKVNSIGEVWSVKRNRPYSVYRDKKGHLRVGTTLKCGTKVKASVHRLVALAFVPNPDNKPCVNHIDCDPSNNRAENLEWVTIQENNAHSHRLGRYAGINRGDSNPISVVTEADVHNICKLLSENYCDKDITSLLGLDVHPKVISDIRHKNAWSWLSDQYEYPSSGRGLPSLNAIKEACELLKSGLSPSDAYKKHRNKRTLSVALIEDISNGIAYHETFKHYK